MPNTLRAAALVGILGIAAWTIPVNLQAEDKAGNEQIHVPMIGEEAPAFAAETTQGNVVFPRDFRGRWVLLFSHPADFTPVCTTEFITLATMQQEFRALNCELLGLSIDSLFSHIAWQKAIQDKIQYKNIKNPQINFPVIADVTMEVAKKYGMLQPAMSSNKTIRAIFFVDPKAKIRAVFYYPLSNGRNFQELKRLLIAMQTSDAYNVATPADWQPGEDVIIPAPDTTSAARERQANIGKDYYCFDWYMCFKKMGKEVLPPAPIKK